MSLVLPQATPLNSIQQLWFTRCPVPTASGIAYNLGWLGEAFVSQGVEIATLQEAPRELARHHFDHRLPTLIREGGNVPALAARSQGEPTRLIGLTWIEEWQTILVRADSGITEPAHLQGKRLALPAYVEHSVPEQVRGSSIARAMSLQGYKGALAAAGLTLEDVALVEVDSGDGSRGGLLANAGSADRMQELWPVRALAEGKVDAVYVKGASAADAARKHGVVVGIDLDRLEPRYRVNNGTPRPITVHAELLENHFDLVVLFLRETLRAADWAAGHLQELRKILGRETRGSAEAIETAYRDGFHLSLHPDLSETRLQWLDQQKRSLSLYGFLEHDFDIAEWADHRPLAAAHAALNSERSTK